MEDDLKNEDNLKNKDDLKNEDDLQNEDNLKNTAKRNMSSAVCALSMYSRLCMKISSFFSGNILLSGGGRLFFRGHLRF